MRAEAKRGTAGRSAAKRLENAGTSERKSESEQAELRQPSSDSFPVVGVGASAGGLEAFSHLLRNVPPDTGMAFVIIQHLDPTHESMLSEILSRDTRMPVGEAASDVRVERDHVYVIPPNRMMQLDDGHLRLAPRGETNGRYMPVDHFFRSLANSLKTRAIGVVLSGTATDGALGIEAIKAEGGITFAQGENSARHDGMPRAAISTGCVDFVLSPENIARELARIARHPHIRLMEAVPKEAAPADRGVGEKILSLLRASTGVDFAHYRQSTIQRRITRRMALKKIDDLEKYYNFLKENPREVHSLYEDMLIRVTRFFRDRETFEFLQGKVFPRILKNRPADSPVRLWVPGCATGEEVYSLVISLIESCKAHRREFPFQVFGTDISETAIEKARAGIYSDNASADVSPERLRRFFVKRDGNHQIAKAVREACVFARHNVLTDPPFLHLDLLSCRNLLIYLEVGLQKRILPIFHHALNPSGFLLLGTAETIGTFGDLFRPEEKHHKVFSKKPGVSRAVFDYSQAVPPHHPAAGSPQGKSAPVTLPAVDALREADRIVLSQYAPPGVVINEAMEVIQFRGHTGRYLEAGSGVASFNVLKMAREGLLADLRAAIQQARKSKSRVRREGVRVKRDGGFEEIRLDVVPYSDAVSDVHHYLILFEPVAAPAGAAGKTEARPRHPAAPARREDRKVERLEQELAATKEYLQAIIEEQESTNEELRSANEEIMSSNEELQSTNEELETTQEELQSANEELKTVNDELQNGNALLTLLSNDLTNLLASVNVPIVMLEMDGRIRRFTAMAEKLFHLVPSDVGRSIIEIRPRIQVPDLSEQIRNAAQKGAVTEREIQDDDGRWHRMRVSPYRTSDGRIDGAVLVFTDIDILKRSEEQLQKSLNYADAVIETVREPLLVLDSGLRVVRANRSFYDTFQLSPEDTVFRPIFELDDGRWNIAALRTLLEKIIPEKQSFHDFEIAQRFDRIGEKTLLLNARQTTPVVGQEALILLAIDDITQRRLADDRLRQVQKLESIGRLAGGIAHDFNNLLNIISAYATVLGEHGGTDEKKRTEGLEAIQKSVQRGSALVRQLLTFARKTDVVF
ncbi:MAG TPA: chemotaxis protein CheB, partial [Thermoanaerobaculia bacterium]|nr:chemotaxis protein CheB [Thermoanaerobaculia bacterium]